MGAIGSSSGSAATIYHEVGQTESTKAGDAYHLPGAAHAHAEATLQIDITGGTATVMIQARIDDDMQWKDCLAAPVTELTADSPAGLRTISWIPQIRVVTSNVSGNPTVHVAVYHGR